jgi:hypothetical protein
LLQLAAELVGGLAGGLQQGIGLAAGGGQDPVLLLGEALGLFLDAGGLIKAGLDGLVPLSMEVMMGFQAILRRIRSRTTKTRMVQIQTPGSNCRNGGRLDAAPCSPAAVAVCAEASSACANWSPDTSELIAESSLTWACF